MPWLPLYCVEDDVSRLLSMLGDDIAFIVPDGKGRWRAVAEHRPASMSRTALWHVPSGPLPLLGEAYSKPNGVPDVQPTVEVADPWAGWTEQRAGADPTTPYFGAGHPGVFWLNLRIPARDADSACGMSSFEWIGNRYGVIGSGARRETKNRWAKLRRQIAKVAERVPRGGFSSAQPPEIWAFPNALKSLEVADINPL